MSDFLKNLGGGLVIVAAAGLLGVTHNAVRSSSVRLYTPYLSGPKEATTTTTNDLAETATEDPAPIDAAEMPEGTITVERMKELFDGGETFILDARDPEAFEEERIPGSINIPYDQLPSYYDQLSAMVPTDAVVVCYCWSPTCDFSDQLAQELKFMGYETILVFTGGWEHWQEAGHPTEGTKAESR